ncbi:MAG: T9SS type A sorting domain-containing protein [Flavobacterium sp.]|nr:T9SS type A sorting domain-containing protein [Flavobacterium sp.]
MLYMMALLHVSGKFKAYIPITTLQTIHTNSTAEHLKVYPNPVFDFFTVNSTEDIDKMELLNVTGQKILDKNNPNKIEILDLSNHSKGVYILKTYIENKVTLAKIIKN